ncbi:hypothetical protein NECAME_01513 [Necator americanus]|uniref:Long-chain-fatty-acid--CoA ligase n=1 Tax=Necator americanus TaxID=51031 RepID=W2TV57_NECAM|nr:hypothetical protein NECAME_01513 [Necator americanus]ETN84951.1 hypothetical protein NECAME_01513 [Necator americanus]
MMNFSRPFTHMPDTPSDALWRIAAFAVIMLLSGRDRWWIVFVLYSIYRLTRTEMFNRIRKTARRDLKGLTLLIRVKLDFKRRLNANRPIHEIFLEQVRKHPQKLACVEVETGRRVTYDELNRLMNKYANYFDVTLDEAISRGLLSIDSNEIFVNEGNVEGVRKLSEEIKSVSDKEPVNRNVNFQDVLCYVYTSGTTGNPKPAVIKHFRYYFMAMGAGRSFEITDNDVIYITMPMYHSAAGIMGIGSMIVFGTSAVIRKKFSASNFWKDCVKFNCTASQYIGEICRLVPGRIFIVMVFASGDILYWDKLGYLYFKDRRGDTFRWKGENVSTTEVEGILQPVMSVVDATVYGVEVGKNEGRAGMAAVVLADGVNVEDFLAEIAKRLMANLANYAIPVFIRLCKEVDRTGLLTYSVCLVLMYK